MLTDNEEKIVSDLLNAQNSDYLIKTAIIRYSKLSADNARNILRLNGQIADLMMENLSKECTKQNQAANMLICQRMFNEDDVQTMFASMVPVCMAMFPSGTAGNGSLAQKEYFAKFKKLLANKKAFNWERDEQWANSYGYTDYLHLVESK